jgi:hypothetical protein
MATFGSMRLLEPGSPAVSGGIFSLNRASSRDVNIGLDEHWTIEIRAGVQSIVARGGSSRSYEESLHEGLGMA